MKRKDKGNGMDRFRAVVAIVVTLIFVGFGAFLVIEAGDAESTTWERWVFVFGAAEAIAFAALGWVFGREVNRQRAEKAEENAEKAQTKAQTEEAKGSALAGMVRGAAGGAGGRERLEAQGGAEGGGLGAALKYAADEYGV